MATPVIQFKRGAFANLPGLRAGEPGFTTDRYDLYVGLTSSTATNKFFGSHRYWNREDGTNSAKLNLVDKGGDNYIALSSPNTLAGIVTYYLPATQGANGTQLTNDGSGNLTWSAGSDSSTFSGITTFTDTTDNTLGNADTGSVQIDGGVGIAKNLTVGAGLSVSGQSYFIGTATFYGGSINLGDSDADDINVAGEFVSNLIPNVDNTYDIGGQGVTAKRWRNANFSGVGTFASGVDASDINIGITAANEIDTTSGILILDSAGGQVNVDDNFETVGITTLASSGGITTTGGSLGVAGDLSVYGAVNFSSDISVTGITTFTDTTNNTLGNADTGAVQIDGGLGVNKNATIGNGLYAGSLEVAGISTFTSAIDANGGATIDNVQIGITNDNEIDTASGNLTIDSAGGLVTIDDELSVTGISTFSGLIDANGGAQINDINIGTTSSNEIDTSSGNLILDSAGGTVQVDDALTVTGDLRLNSNNILASDANTNITLTSNTLTTFAGDIRVNGNDIQDSAGNSVFTFDGSQNVTANQNLTVSGNLFVTGNTTQVNSTSMTIEDRTIELGIVDGSAPTTTTTWDLGVLFNYYDGSAKKAGVTWEGSSSRIVFGAELSDGAGTGNNNPQLTYTSYAPIEIGALWVNDCAGQSQVISCTGSERFLENITVDGGTF
jgi:hypothetical protein